VDIAAVADSSACLEMMVVMWGVFAVGAEAFVVMVDYRGSSIVPSVLDSEAEAVGVEVLSRILEAAAPPVVVQQSRYPEIAAAVAVAAAVRDTHCW
jgi:hypothetical protein